MTKDRIANLIIVVGIIFGVGFFTSKIPFENIKYFFNSNFFVSLVTAVVGLFAIYLYITQQNDRKRDAANIVLMEVRNAEGVIDQLKQTENFNGSVFLKLVPTNNWSKHNYLFISDLDRDELDFINDFYNQCEMIDKAMDQMSVATQLKQKADHIQQKIIQMAEEESAKYIVDQEAMSQFQFRKNKFLQIAGTEGYVFNPENPLLQIRKSLTNVQKITTSSAGNTLKKIAKLK